VVFKRDFVLVLTFLIFLSAFSFQLSYHGVWAQAPPDPWVDKPIYVNDKPYDPNNPPSINLGETVKIRIAGINYQGGDASEAYLGISFPDLTSTSSYVRIVSSNAPNYKAYPPGSPAWGGYGTKQLTLKYWLVEAWAAPWKDSKTWYWLEVSVKPEKAGPFIFHVKMTAKGYDGKWYADPTTSGQRKSEGGAVVLDFQQSEYAYAYWIDVKSPSIEAAQIVSIGTDKAQYSIGETVNIPFTIKNTGNVKLHLRVIVNVEDPKGVIVYDSHKTSPVQDKEYWLDPGQQASGAFQWAVPSGASQGTYKILASLRNWDDWNKIYDYRWGDKPGPTFKVIILAKASIILDLFPSGQLKPGDVTSTTVRVKNTGVIAKSFWIDLSFQKPGGSLYNLPSKQTKALAPNEESTLSFSWVIPSDAPAGTYSLITHVYAEDPTTSSAEVLDTDIETFAFMIDRNISYIEIMKATNNGGKGCLIHIHISKQDLEKYKITTYTEFYKLMEKAEITSENVKKAIPGGLFPPPVIGGLDKIRTTDTGFDLTVVHLKVPIWGLYWSQHEAAPKDFLKAELTSLLGQLVIKLLRLTPPGGSVQLLPPSIVYDLPWYYETLKFAIPMSAIDVQPRTWSDMVIAGKSASETFTISASGGTVKGVTVTKISGPDWLTLSPTSLGDIPAGSSKTFTVTASPPAGTTGSFNYLIRVTCTEGEPKSIDISGTITVTPITPVKLAIRVHNNRGPPLALLRVPMPKEGGSIFASLYTHNLVKVASKIIEYSGGEDHVALEFDVVPGEYVVFIENAPKGGLRLLEYWGEMGVTAPGIHDFYRHTQVIDEVRVDKNTITLGDSVEVSVKVRNLEGSSQKRTCEYIGTRVKLILDRDRAEPWDYEVYFPAVPPSIKIPYDGGVESFLFKYTPKDPGTYYLYALSEGNYYNIMGKAVFEGTDQYGWVEAFTVQAQKQPDLIVEKIEMKVYGKPAGSNPQEGDTVEFLVTVKNVGAAPAPSGWYVDYYLDGKFMKRDGPAIAVGAGASVVSSYSWKAPEGSAGKHTLKVVVDPTNVVSEGNEGNNEKSMEFVVEHGIVSVTKGDLNNDTVIDAVDLVLMKKMVLGMKPPVDFNHDGKIDDTDYSLMKLAADMNDDGNIDAVDLVFLKKLILRGG
jgi:hypothetical protein